MSSSPGVLDAVLLLSSHSLTCQTPILAYYIPFPSILLPSFRFPPPSYFEPLGRPFLQANTWPTKGATAPKFYCVAPWNLTPSSPFLFTIRPDYLLNHFICFAGFNKINISGITKNEGTLTSGSVWMRYAC